MPESHKERVDRELIELLNELRIVLPGVQVLFGFLLVVPFQSGFSEVTDLERGIYYLAFVSAAMASVLLIAPSTYHRLRFRDGAKESLVRLSGRLLVAGTAFLAVSLAATVFLITDVLFGDGPAIVATLVAAGVVAGLWFAIPLSHRAVGAGAEGGKRGEDR
jgi:Family of unknown function (DUF6328)